MRREFGLAYHGARRGGAPANPTNSHRARPVPALASPLVNTDVQTVTAPLALSVRSVRPKTLRCDLLRGCAKIYFPGPLSDSRYATSRSKMIFALRAMTTTATSTASAVTQRGATSSPTVESADRDGAGQTRWLNRHGPTPPNLRECPVVLMRARSMASGMTGGQLMAC